MYTDKTGIDDDGFPVHSSIYKSLNTNGQKQLMEFPDFPFPEDSPNFTTHKKVHVLHFLYLVTQFVYIDIKED